MSYEGLDIDWIDSWQMRSREDVHPSHEEQVLTIQSLKSYLKMRKGLISLKISEFDEGNLALVVENGRGRLNEIELLFRELNGVCLDRRRDHQSESPKE